MDVAEEVRSAHKRIATHVRETPVEHSLLLSRRGCNVYCKLENLQHTGSFKVRGAMNKLLSIRPESRARGVVTASTGNHGLAVAYAMRQTGASGTIFVTEGADPSKIQAIERLGGNISYRGKDCVETEIYAREYATENRMTYIPPYNDPEVIGGQGTIGIELAHQLDQIDVVFVSVGGGGLISGIAGYLKAIHPSLRIVGCSPESSQVMVQSVKEGRIVDMPSLPTLSDGTAGGVEPGSITFELCRTLVDEFITVTEEEITDALRVFIDAHHMLIEGAAAVAIASYRKADTRWAGRNSVIVICGANISRATLKEVL
jgi:threonine dehydratase